MKSNYFVVVFCLLCACNSADKPQSSPENKTIGIRLNPISGSDYYYETENESVVLMRANEQEAKTVSRIWVACSCHFYRDSLKNLLVTFHYLRFKIFTQSGDEQITVDSDAKKGVDSPAKETEMFSLLKSVPIVVVLDENAHLKEVRGMDRITQVLADKNKYESTEARENALKQLQRVCDQFIVKNIEQLFGIFPDKGLQEGNEWTILTSQNTDFNLKVNAHYRLKGTDSTGGTIVVNGKISSNESPVVIEGTSAIAKATGNQTGSYKVAVETGMIKSANVVCEVNGLILAGNQKMPVSIKSRMVISGKKITAK